MSSKEERTKGGRHREEFQHKVEWRMEEEAKKKTAWDREWSNLLQFPSGISPVTCPKHIPVTHLSHIKHATHKASHTHVNDCALLKKVHGGAAHCIHGDLVLAAKWLHWSRWGLFHIRRLKGVQGARRGYSPSIHIIFKPSLDLKKIYGHNLAEKASLCFF